MTETIISIMLDGETWSLETKLELEFLGTIRFTFQKGNMKYKSFCGNDNDLRKGKNLVEMALKALDL